MLAGTCLGGGFDFNDYYGWQTHINYLNCLANTYTDRAQTINIGNSIENRALTVMKIGRPRTDGTSKPAVWIDGGIHAREWISPSSVEYVIHELVENYREAENKNLVDNLDIYVLPISNPDGYVVLSYSILWSS